VSAFVREIEHRLLVCNIDIGRLHQAGTIDVGAAMTRQTRKSSNLLLLQVINRLQVVSAVREPSLV